jgi:hypothetical protein
VEPILRFSNQFGLEGNRVGTIRLAGSQQPHQKDSAIVQCSLKRYLFARILIPLQIALLDKKILSAVPSGCFYLIQACYRKASIVQHPGPPQ